MDNNDASSSPPSKKLRYKGWLANKDILIPLRTRTRFDDNYEMIEEIDENRSNKNLESFIEDTFASCSQDHSLSSDTTSEIDENKISNDDSESDCSESEQSADDTVLPYSDSSDEDNGENIQNIYLDVDNLYKDSNQTTDEGVFSVAKLFLENNLTGIALQQLLTAVSKMLQVANNMPQTKFKFFEYLKKAAPPVKVIEHYYCNYCHQYIGDELINKAIFQCLKCKNTSYKTFHELDLIHQLKFMFEKMNLAKLINVSTTRNPNVITDVTDGSEYKRVNYLERIRGPYDLTLLLFIDGISLKASSKASCWPIMYTIAEIPKNQRNKFVLISGVWYDKKHATVNTLFHPFVEKLNKAYTDGIDWIHPESQEACNSKVVAPLIICDAPARAQIQNLLQYNGKHGCNICEIKTKRIKPSQMEQTKSNIKKRRGRIYPFIKKHKMILRSHHRMLLQGKKALKLNES